MAQVRFALAFFLGVLLQTLLVGLFIPLLIVASYAQWKRVSKGRQINFVMAFATVFFGLTIAAHWILGVRRIILATLYLPPGVTIDRFLQPPYSTEEIIRRAIFQFQVVVGDLIMIHRLYHIYEKNLPICIVPSIATAGLFAIGCGLTNQLRHLDTPAELQASNDWSAACFCSNLLNCGFMTVAIALRLLKVHRQTISADVNSKDSIIMRALRVLVESAALWALSVLMGFFAFLAKSNLRYTFLAVTSPLVGISFCLIIVRLGSPTPEVRNDTWQGSRLSRASKVPPISSPRLSKAPVSLASIKVDKEVTVDASESAIVEFHLLSPASPREK